MSNSADILRNNSDDILRFASANHSADILGFASGVVGLQRVTWRQVVIA